MNRILLRTVSALAALVLMLAVAAPGRAQALDLSDTGWVNYGDTSHTRPFTSRTITLNTPNGRSGVIYIHKDDALDRGSEYPFLPFGLSTPLMWERSGLFDLTVGDESDYLYHHLSALPEFLYIEKRPDRMTLKVTFPVGDAGEIAMLVGTRVDQPYLDMTLDLSKFRHKQRPVSLVLRAIPSHPGVDKQGDIPFNRMMQRASQAPAPAAGEVAFDATQPWVLLYDQQLGVGSCAVLFDSKVVKKASITGRHRLNLHMQLARGTTLCRFFLWEFPASKFSLEDASGYLAENTESLLAKLSKQAPEKDIEDEPVSYPGYAAARQRVENITLDGKLDEAIWRQTPWSEPFVSIKQNNPVPADQTRFKAAANNDSLYFAIRCNEAAMSQLHADTTEHDADSIFRDDSIELFLSPQNTAANYLHLVFNTRGVRRDAIAFDNQGGKTRLDWNPRWEVAIVKDDAGWTAEVRIPLSDLLLTDVINDRWMLNVTRNDYAGPDRPDYYRYTTWSRFEGGFQQPEKFNELTNMRVGLDEIRDAEGFAAFGMVAPRRGDKKAQAEQIGVEIVEDGSYDFYLYYPENELYFPADHTQMRTLFNFRETRQEYMDKWGTAAGIQASREYAKQIEFHFLLPEGVSVVGDLAYKCNAYMQVERLDDRHVVLHPLYPHDHGEMWFNMSLRSIPIFLNVDLPEGARKPIDAWVEYKQTGEKSCVIRSYINVVKFPKFQRIERLVVDPYWRNYSDYATFPHYLDYLQRVGFTHLPVFVPDLLDDAGKMLRDYDKDFAKHKRQAVIDMVRQARERGIKIDLCDSTFNTYGLSPNTARWGNTPYADPFYTGELYWYDIKNVTDAYEAIGGADLISMDIEVFKRITERQFGYFDQSPEDVARVEKMAAEQGVSIQEIFTDVGTRMIDDVRGAIAQSNEKLDLKRMPDFVVWNVQMNKERPMEGLFDGYKLYPDKLQYLGPELYAAASDMRSIAGTVREQALKATPRRILPTASTAFLKDLPYTQVRDVLLEAFFNGATGVQYWPVDFDQNDAYGQTLALYEIAPVQDILADGDLHVQTEDAKAPTQVVGLVKGNEAAMLASNYRDGSLVKVAIKNPLNIATDVYDLATRKKVAHLEVGEEFEVELNDRRTRTYYFGPGRDW